MEEYEDMENDASGAPDATTVTGGQEHEAASQKEQMIRQLDVGVERNRFGNAGVLKAASGNVAKRLKMRETRVTTRAGKTVEAAAKQMATQELQMEKARMEEWKENVIREVAHELRGMRQAQEEAMEAQRRTFQVELEKVTEELERVKLRSTALEKEIKTSKAQKSAQKQNYAQKNPGAKGVTTTKVGRPEIVEIRDSQSTKSTQADMDTTPAPPNRDTNARIERRDYTSVAASKPAKIPEQPWTEVSYGTRKPKGKQSSPTIGQEQLGRRILFPRNPGQEKSEADLMLALNEALQQAGEATGIRFTRV